MKTQAQSASCRVDLVHRGKESEVREASGKGPGERIHDAAGRHDFGLFRQPRQAVGADQMRKITRAVPARDANQSASIGSEFEARGATGGSMRIGADVRGENSRGPRDVGFQTETAMNPGPNEQVRADQGGDRIARKAGESDPAITCPP